MRSSAQVLIPDQLFDRRFSAAVIKKTLTCLKCRNAYSLHYEKPLGEHFQGRRPILLPCGHSMCENCVYRNIRHLECSICLQPCGLTSAQCYGFRKRFDLNYFMIGQLNNIRYHCNSNSNNGVVNLSGNNVELATFLKASPKCNQCDHGNAVGSCNRCEPSYFCRPCFNKIHMNNRTMKSHKLKLLPKKSIGDQQYMEKLPLANPQKCQSHQRMCTIYCYDCDLTYCTVCVQNDHKLHHYVQLVVMNKKVMNQMHDTQANIELAHEHLRMANEGLNTFNARLECYAINTTEKISAFFEELHSFLQNEEARIYKYYSEKNAKIQLSLQNACSEIHSGHYVLNQMKHKLDVYQAKIPANICLHNIIQNCDKKIQEIQSSRVDIPTLNQNPFIFDVQHGLAKEFGTYYRADYQEPNINIQFCSVKNAQEESADLSSLCRFVNPCRNDSSLINLPLLPQTSNAIVLSHVELPSTTTNLSLNGSFSNQAIFSAMNTDRSSFNISKAMNNSLDVLENNNWKARISHINSPDNFYVQCANIINELKDAELVFQSCCVPNTIHQQRIYMGYKENDKQSYRCVLKQVLPNDMYEMFLIDVGKRTTFEKQNILEVDEMIATLPYAAIQCALHSIRPAGSSWTEEANNLMMELANHKEMSVHIIEHDGNRGIFVDLSIPMENEDDISMRDAFLYTGLARELPEMPSEMSLIAKPSNRYKKQCFLPDTVVLVKVVHVEDPKEFYVIKLNEVERKKKFLDKLNYFYGVTNDKYSLNKVYLGKIHMRCVAHIRDSWHRVCIEEIQNEGNIRVRFVDEGYQKTVKWNQLFTLNETFAKAPEYTFRCSLIDIEPHQRNNYTWTAESISEFSQFIKNPNLQMVVHSNNQNGANVQLFITRCNNYLNIGTLLVDFDHGVSTGDSTSTIQIERMKKKWENIKKSSQSNSASDSYAQCSLVSSSVDTISNRSIVKITHIVSPSEVYMYLADLEPGIRNFHREIQNNTEAIFNGAETTSSDDSNDDMTVDNQQWKVGDHCFVHINYQTIKFVHPQNECYQCELYRGIVTAVTEIKSQTHDDVMFDIYLRDIGDTVSSINSTNLYSISRKWDIVSDTVQKCHLSCVKPTGSQADWSRSAIDFMHHAITKFDVLSVTQYDKRAQDMQSLPIVLWGATVETTSALAPDIHKHTNINRILVRAGLAYFVNEHDFNLRLDEVLLKTKMQNEITLEHWNQEFTANKALQEPDEIKPVSTSFNMACAIHEHLLEPLHIENNIPIQYTTPEAWLQSKPIEKSLFVARVSYVDHKSHIFMHQTEDIAMLDVMRRNIRNAYNKQKIYTTNQLEKLTYQANQPCIAIYHMDKFFYRCIVLSYNRDNQDYNALFIDYGNIEQVKPSDMRPFVPYPKVLSFASKYLLGGIRPLEGEDEFSTEAMDIIHKLIVEKTVTVRVNIDEMNNPIKRCEIRIGHINPAKTLLDAGLVEKEYNCTPRSSQEENTTAMQMGAEQPPPRKVQKMLAPLQKTRTSVHNENVQKNLRGNEIRQLDRTRSTNLSGMNNSFYHSKGAITDLYTSDNDDASDDSTNNDHLEIDENLLDILNRMDQTQSELDAAVTKEDFLPHEQLNSHRKLNKVGKRNDRFHPNGDKGVNEDSDWIFHHSNSSHYALNNALIADDDNDIGELEQSFANSYWHCHVGGKANESDDDSVNKESETKEVSILYSDFLPTETSSQLSHYSGVDNLRLPSSVHTFPCSVVAIRTPINIHIFPETAEFKYRDDEMGRLVQQLARASPQLLEFTTRTLCLARFSKDRLWYRAMVQNFNCVSKTVDVIYIDYLNVESVSMDQLRQYPKELSGWALRTIEVRLHGIRPVARMRSSDVMRALTDACKGRQLLARIMTPVPIGLLKENNMKLSGRSMNDTDAILKAWGSKELKDTMMEVELFDRKNKTSICAELVSKHFYKGI